MTQLVVAREYRFQPQKCLAIAVLGLTAFSQPGLADQTKLDNDNYNLNSSGAWSGNQVPGTADIAIFNGGLAGVGGYAFTIATDNTQSWKGIQLSSPASSITFNAGNLLTLGAGGIDMSGATSTLAMNNNVRIAATQTWNVFTTLTQVGTLGLGNNVLAVTGPGVTVITGDISGSGTIVQSGAGILSLAGRNLNSGGLWLTSGTLTIGSTMALGSGVLTIGGGTIAVTANGLSENNAVSVAGPVTIRRSSGNFAWNGIFSGGGTVNWSIAAGAVESLNGGVDQFSGYTGTISLGSSAGILRIQGDDDHNFGNAVINLGTSSATLSNNNSGTQTIGGLAGGEATQLRGPTGSTIGMTYVIGSANVNTTFSGSILNGFSNSLAVPVSIAKTGTGTLTLEGIGTSNYSGALSILSGQLTVGSMSAFGAATASNSAMNLIISSAGAPATLQYMGSAGTLTRGMTINSAATIDASGSGAILFSSTNSIAVGAAAGPRTLTLTGTNTDLNTIIPAIRNGAGIVTSVVKNGEGTWLLKGSADYTGGTKINAGKFLVGAVNGSPTGTGAVVVNGGIFGGTGNVGGPTVVNDGGRLSPGIPGAAAGIGTLNLTVSSGLTLNSGSILDLDFKSVPASSDLISLADGTLSLTGPVSVNVYQAGTSVLFTGPGDYDIFAFNLNTPANLSGNLANLAVANKGNSPLSYTFNLIDNGTTGKSFIRLHIAGGSDGYIWNGNASDGNWMTAANWVSHAAPGASGDVITFGSAGGSAGSVVLNVPLHAGEIIFDNNNSYTLNAGTDGKLFLDGGAHGAAIYIVTGSHIILADVELMSDTAIHFSTAGNTLTISGVIGSSINPAAGISVAGPGRLILGGNNVFSGAASVGPLSTLQIGDGSSSGLPGNGAVIDNGTVVFNRSDVFSIGNEISGGGALAQAGTGTATLSGLTSLAGNLAVSGGMLVFAGEAVHTVGDITGTGAVRVAAGSSLISKKLTLHALKIDGIHTIALGGNTSKVDSLTIAGSPISAGGWTGKLDITDHSLIIESVNPVNKVAVMATLADQIASGRGTDNAWTHTGIVSSRILNDTPAESTLALVDAMDLADSPTSFGGQVIDVNSVIITRAVFGDADLSGIVDLADFDIWFSHVGFSTYSYALGDLNSDGIVDLADFDLWFNHVGFTGPSLVPDSKSAVAVPEPASLALLAICGIGFTGRHRARSGK